MTFYLLFAVLLSLIWFLARIQTLLLSSLWWHMDITALSLNFNLFYNFQLSPPTHPPRTAPCSYLLTIDHNMARTIWLIQIWCQTVSKTSVVQLNTFLITCSLLGFSFQLTQKKYKEGKKLSLDSTMGWHSTRAFNWVLPYLGFI